MARRPAQFGTAQVKKREPVRPLLVLLLIAAGGILLFLWLEADTVDPLVAVPEEQVAEEATPAASNAKPKVPAAATNEADEDLADWWYDVESLLFDAFESLDDAKSGSCSDLEYAVSDLGAVKPRMEQQIRSPFSALVGALDSAVAACRSENAPAVAGAESSAKAQLKSLLRNLEGFGIARSTMLADFM